MGVDVALLGAFVDMLERRPEPLWPWYGLWTICCQPGRSFVPGKGLAGFIGRGRHRDQDSRDENCSRRPIGEDFTGHFQT